MAMDSDTHRFSQTEVVDLSPFTTTNGDDAARRRAANDLQDKLKINGCVAISGHGVAPDLVEEAFAMVKKFFALPHEDKMKAPHPEAPVPHRGYSRTGSENVAAAVNTEGNEAAEISTRTKDFKESFEIGSEDNTDEPNIWPPEDACPGFREFGLRFYWELNKTAKAVLDALILSLNLTATEAERLRSLHTGHKNQLRLLHYPPIDKTVAADKDSLRLGAHQDWSSFTFLFQDSTGGLQFLDRQSSTFVDALPMDHVLYMNIGDMFERISNGLYPSALHKVVMHNANRDRYSIPYFASPLGDSTIEPQASLVEKMGKRNYEPTTPRKYGFEKYKEIRGGNE